MTLRSKLLLLIIPALFSAALLSVGVATVLFYKKTDIPYVGAWAALLLFFVAFSIVALLWSVTGSVGRSLQEIIQSTHQIAQGDFERPLPKCATIRETQELLRAMSQMQQNLKQYEKREKEEAVYRELGKMTAHVAHDLASPLSSMQTALEHFKDLKAVGGKTPEYINLLELSAKRLKGISKELLDQYKGREPKKIFYALHKVLDEMVGEYQSQDCFGCVEFKKQYSREQIYLYGDRAKIQRVFGNLIKNAVEAMDSCGTLTVRTKLAEGRALIEIEDTGPGMAPELLEKVLQGGISRGKADGHGIGTQVVRKTVEEYQGTLSATSEIGVGTTFRVDLPLPESLEVKGAEREEDIVEEFEIISKRGESVIVIDDDPSFLEQWRLLLEKEKKSSLLCVSYEDFMAQELGAKFGKTAVVDYHFENSERNGIEVVAELKKLGFAHLYLCTVEYWKPHLKKQAADLGVKICPKPLPKIAVCHSEPRAKNPDGIGIASTPVEPRNDKREYKVLVIDDDLVIRMGWELAVKKLGIGSLFAFENLEQLLGHDLDLSAIDLAFVDKNIKGSQFGGADCIGHLRKWGAKKIILASGEDEETLRQDPAFEQADFIISEKIPTSFKAFFS